MLAKKLSIQSSKITLWCVGLLVSGLLVCFWFNTVGKVPQSSYELAKTVRYSFLVSNGTGEFIENAHVSVFAPVKKNSYQLIERITANQSFDTKIDQSGNQSLLFQIKGLAPHASQIISITAKLRLASRPQFFGVKAEVFLQPEANIEVDSPEIMALAGKLSGDVKKIASWIYRNITDTGYMAEDRGARYAITRKKGDCTEFASAFVGLARASNVPARMIGGFTADDSGRLRAENYHNWAEYKRGEAWSIADPQNNIIDSGYGSYIAFYNFDKYSRLENSQRFLSYDHRLSVQML
ncbi:transglutaminase-like domain-containing protein [Microbulbifer hainanensis]|uniref:transglutaminase-like domain-containing protein n=1 Tax=Microbulbifer hainanensis TaxID=2735675 RepID=UPI0018692FB2|nr:transglutaminase-like domain-containing protein [Microbulbifer hainanensis]